MEQGKNKKLDKSMIDRKQQNVCRREVLEHGNPCHDNLAVYRVSDVDVLEESVVPPSRKRRPKKTEKMKREEDEDEDEARIRKERRERKAE